MNVKSCLTSQIHQTSQPSYDESPRNYCARCDVAVCQSLYPFAIRWHELASAPAYPVTECRSNPADIRRVEVVRCNEAACAMPNPAPFSDYLVFVDESGDHNLIHINPEFPVFVLLFAVIHKDAYVNHVCPGLQRFKFEFWGHDEVVLHEHEIRKPFGDFLFLVKQPVRERFLAGLSAQMEALPATVVAVIIDKTAYAARYHEPVNPYDYAMETGLERVFRHLESLGQSAASTAIIVEKRGRREDAELELAFRRVCDGANALHRSMPFQLVMIPKSSNSPGLQLTDLMARPVALHHLRPAQPNRAFEIIATKLRRSPSGESEGWGLKRLP